MSDGKIRAAELPGLKLKKGAGRRFRNHYPWIFSNELETVPKLEPGELCALFDQHGQVMAIGYFNPRSLIAFRILSRKESLPAGFVGERLRKAVDQREGAYPAKEARRVVFGESDGLPGLIVDDYRGAVVVQFLTAGMERLKEEVLASVKETLKPKKIILRNDSSVRDLEGLKKESLLLEGKDPLVKTRFTGIEFEFDGLRSQKTGLFLDQRENLELLGNFDLRGRRALDLFCYFGSWGLNALKRGASEATFVDSSRNAVETVNRTAAKCGFDGARTLEGNVFEILSDLRSDGETYDIVFSDPPAFAKSGRHVKEAYKAYTRLNESCLRLLRNGGVLVASSCSYHVPQEMFLESLRDAAAGARRNARLLFYGRQSQDHPVLLSFPESSYLKTVFLKVVD